MKGLEPWLHSNRRHPESGERDPMAGDVALDAPADTLETWAVDEQDGIRFIRHVSPNINANSEHRPAIEGIFRAVYPNQAVVFSTLPRDDGNLDFIVQPPSSLLTPEDLWAMKNAEDYLADHRLLPGTEQLN